MGLAVTAYEIATIMEPHNLTSDCWTEHERAFIIDPGFARSLRGLVADRCYLVSGKTARVSNSYPGHGRFRERLAAVFHDTEPQTIWDAPDDWVDRSFFELICFADNEGTIGGEAAADLLADFEAGAAQWAADVSEDDWMRSEYDAWTEVCRVAAGGGMVVFA
jgi:hypothetical protein